MQNSKNSQVNETVYNIGVLVALIILLSSILFLSSNDLSTRVVYSLACLVLGGLDFYAFLRGRKMFGSSLLQLLMFLIWFTLTTYVFVKYFIFGS